MDKELAGYLKFGHRIRWRDQNYRVVNTKVSEGLMYATCALVEDWHDFEILHGCVKNDSRSIDPAVEVLVPLAEASAEEIVQFMYKGKTMSIKTGDCILLNEVPTRFFFVDRSHIEYRPLNSAYTYTYHLQQFVDLISMCDAELELLPNQVA